ncbi:monooxygenase [bacterium]|nr:monooxygenase [bacterium]
MRVAIAGAGIGGLTAALALLARGHDVIVLERAGALAEVGAGVQLSPNAMHVLAALGLAPALDASATRPLSLDMRWGGSGRVIFSIPAGTAIEQRHGAPYLNILRADLQSALVSALMERGPGVLRLGAEVTAVLSGEGLVRAELADGEGVEADLLIGADGLHSRVRSAVVAPTPPRFTGMTAWRALIPAARLAHPPPRSAIVWVGPGRHAVTYFVAGGALLNFVGVVEARGDPAQREDWAAQGDVSALRSAFADWAPPVADAVAAADSAACWPLFDRDPPGRWTKGRVALLGDACHPMPPFLAQGGAMAIEDAWVLGDAISRGTGSIETRLQDYESRRRIRTARMLRGARRNARLFHLSPPPVRWAVYTALSVAAGLAPAFIASRQDWIYGCDVTLSAD